MEQKRSGLVPIGDISIDVPGVGRQLTVRRQARHFTTLDQVTQLVAARDAAPEIGFMARLLALCSMPRTNPGDQHEFKRVNGPYTLYMTAGAGNKLPYGSAAPALGVGLLRSGTDAKPRAHPRGFALGVHAAAARPRSLPVAHIPDVRAQAPAVPHVAATLPAVRREPGDGEQSCSAGFPPGLSTRVKENQERVAGPALPDGQGGAAALAVAAGDRAVATAPRGIAVNVACSPRGCL